MAECKKFPAIQKDLHLLRPHKPAPEIEFGGYVKPVWQAPAGTKRISNLLRSRQWSVELIETYTHRLSSLD